MNQMIKHIEELAINAWPALSTQIYDGWIMRFAGGYTRRSNSINPLYDSTIDINEKITYSESVYTNQGLRPTYKMTRAVHPVDLDDVLARKGYTIDAETSIKIVSLINMHDIIPEDVEITDTLEKSWHTAFLTFNNVDKKNHDTHNLILHSINNPTIYASTIKDGRITGCGLGVVERNHVGIFDLVVDPAYRQRGYGRKIMKAILGKAQQIGATRSYLQVMCNNPAANNLYDSLGYQEIYRYWYRIKNR